MDTETPQPRIADYVRPLLARWWLIVVAVIVATVGVYAYYARKPNEYTTSTLVYVTLPGNPLAGLQAATPTDRTVDDVASLLDSLPTAAAVARSIDYHGTPANLLGQTSISSKPGQDFIQIAAQAEDPAQAAAIVNGFARQFVTSLTDSYLSQIHKSLALTRTQLAQVPPGAAGQISRAALTSQLDNLQLALGVPATVARQVEQALPPGSPTYPKPVRNALFALLISLVAAVALAYGLERFDRRLKSPDEMERAYGSPLLAVLPHTGDPVPTDERGEPALGPDFREPFRVLRTNLELASVDSPPRTIVVTSAMPGEGKSTVVRNLALALREAGRRVAVVDLDLRHPAMGRLYGAPIGPGVTDVMRREAKLEDVAVPIGVGVHSFDEFLHANDHSGSANGDGANGRNGTGAHRAEVALILGGAPSANPPAVLASSRLVEVLDELRDSYDVVLIDSAPALAVTDPVPLLRYADATLFVGRLHVTTRDTARRLMEFLRRVPDAHLLGIVANDLSRLDAEGYGYGYGYGYGNAPRKPQRRFRRQRAAAERQKLTV